MLREAIDAYHEILSEGNLAAETDAEMRGHLRQMGLYFGDRPICTVLRPHFYFTDQWAYLKHETEILLGAFARAHEACLHSAQLRQQLALQAYEEQLFSLDIGGVVPWTTSRLDSFFRPEQGKLQFVEYNAETPAGMGYGDVLVELFEMLQPMKRFERLFHVRAMPMLKDLLSVLLQTYAEWGGVGKPQIAIMDWQDVPTLNEHELTRRYFEHEDVHAFLVDPRAVEYRGGALWAGDRKIDLIYKRVLINELIERLGVDNPIVHAYRDHAVLMSNSFSCKLMAKKASFAFLSDERNAHLFTAEQRTAIEQHIPWTRLISDRKTEFQGREVDLLEFLSENRERFVLKPNDEYGGKGVTLGWECAQDEWNEALRQALATPSVVQHRVESITRLFPSWIDGSLDISPRYVDADPYVFSGRTVYGCLTRLSSVSLLNVTAGGGSVVPMFLLERREH
ncbi:MAG: circularly permuted type 2 ATP-grasp protein [Chloroflexi bacterium]|nr:circularly permuted type 2 ATP-grasp protein [Chloroflexota bacterium]